MKKAGTILIYNCNGPKCTKMRHIFAMLHLLMRQVTPDKYELTLRELVDGTGEPKAEAGEPIAENMLVFCGMHSALLRQVLEVLRLAELPPIQYKAILTETNQAWNTQQLIDALEEEKKAVAKAREEALAKTRNKAKKELSDKLTSALADAKAMSAAAKAEEEAAQAEQETAAEETEAPKAE